MAKPDPNRAAAHAAALAQKQQARKDAAAAKQAAHVAAVQQKQSAHAADQQSRQAAAAQKRQAALDAKAAKQAARNAPVNVPAPVDNSLSPQPYAAGGSGAAATGYGGGYGYDAATADNGGAQSTGGDSTAQADKKASSGLSTKSKVLIGVGGGVAVVGFVLYRRYVSRPLRRYRQVKGALQGIIGGYKNFRAELAKG